MSRLRNLTAGVIAYIAAATSLAAAQTITLAEGAVFDGILDGFPMLAPLDGQPDFGGNALAVALQAGVTEERGVGEFPLAPLAGIAPAQIANAVLVFNIDDVLSTFGPGTAFSGRAASRMFVHTYSGNGTVDVADFLAVGRAPTTIDTTGFGPIDDARLRQNGPLVFEVDVTQDLRETLIAGATALGIVWRTEDSPTGTSLDDLGDGGAGPVGVAGAALPFIVIELVAPTPVPSATPPATNTVAAASPTPSPTNTPAPPTATHFIGPCVGDCDGDGQIRVAEIITGVNIAIGRAEMSRCPGFDHDGSDSVAINELVLAVNASLRGCV